MIGNLRTIFGFWVPDSVVPAEEDVEDGVLYGTQDQFEGTLDPGAAPDYPTEADVEYGVSFSNGDKTGTLVLPSAGDVRYGVEFGASAEYTGTLGDPAPDPSESDFASDFSAAALVIMEQFAITATYTRVSSLQAGTVATGFPKTIPVAFSYGGAGQANHRSRKRYQDSEGDALQATAQVYSDSTNGVTEINPDYDKITDANGDTWTVKGIINRSGGLWTLQLARYLRHRAGRPSFEVDR